MHRLAEKRILISEDQPMLATLLRAILTKAGLNVIGVAADGQEEVQMALEQHPDIILSDIEMPRMDGLTAAQHILAKYPACVIFVTGNSDVQSQQQAAQVGASGYILKPYDRQHLLEQVRDAVVGWQADHQSLPGAA